MVTFPCRLRSPFCTHRHVGDLGNIEADATGRATIAITDHMVKLNGPISVIGRAFVVSDGCLIHWEENVIVMWLSCDFVLFQVHAGEDDLGLGGNQGSLLTGNAGGRVGCCTIGIA